MSLSNNQKIQIKNILSEKIESKLKSYDRETTSMPFLARLIQDSEKIAAYSFIHSMATSLGMSIYEDVSVIIASENCDECYRNYGVGGVISKEQKTIINRIVTDLRNGNRDADIEQEKKEVLRVPSTNGVFQKSGNIADFYKKRNVRSFILK